MGTTAIITSVRGISETPDWVASKPSSSCMNTGSRNRLAISIANITEPISVPEAKTGSLNSLRFTAGRPEVAERLGALTQYLAHKGLDLDTARMAAQRLLGGIVAKQSLVMTFEKLFLLSGVAFVCVMPLLYFLKAPKTAAPSPKAEVHVEM